VTSLVLALFYLGIGAHVYQDAKRNGQWSWSRFVLVLAATGVFMGAFIVPLAMWSGGRTHPGVLLTAMLSGIAAFVIALSVVLRRTVKKAMPGTTPTPPEHIP
jgi:uncharacterized membrane protein YhaH (DUF805 family)